MKKLLKILKWLAIIVALLALAAWTFMNFHPVFGGKPDEGSLKRIPAPPTACSQAVRWHDK